jgi:hypothetical protein
MQTNGFMYISLYNYNTYTPWYLKNNITFETSQTTHSLSLSLSICLCGCVDSEENGLGF